MIPYILFAICDIYACIAIFILIKLQCHILTLGYFVGLLVLLPMYYYLEKCSWLLEFLEECYLYIYNN